MAWRDTGGIDLASLTALLLAGGVGYSAWLTSIVFCATNGLRPLMFAAAAFFPVGVVHGVGVWFGGW